eukprot:1591925-Alexandrium_andersonii.AAC.1
MLFTPSGGLVHGAARCTSSRPQRRTRRPLRVSGASALPRPRASLGPRGPLARASSRSSSSTVLAASPLRRQIRNPCGKQAATFLGLRSSSSEHSTRVKDEPWAHCRLHVGRLVERRSPLTQALQDSEVKKARQAGGAKIPGR